MKIKNDVIEIFQSKGVDTSNLKNTFKKIEVDDDILADIIVDTETFFFFIFTDDELDEISVDSTLQEYIDMVITKVADDYGI